MSDPKQLRILLALTEHLEGVTPANGYEVDLQGHVFRGRSNFGADEATPFLSILESPRPDPRPNEVGYEKLVRAERWELLIQGWCEENRDFPTDGLYRLKAIVEGRLAQIVMTNKGTDAATFPSIYRLGGLISGLRIGPGIVRAATPQIGGTEAFYLPIWLSYAINLADPYASI